MAQSKLTKSLKGYFGDYEKYHQTRGCKLTHYIGIPIVVLSMVGLLATVVLWEPQINGFFRLDLGLILWAAAVLFAVVVDWKIGLPYTLFTFGIYAVSRVTPLSVLWVFFVLGWFFQFLGHYYYEKKSPAFLKNLTHLFVGPLWIFARMLHYR